MSLLTEAMETCTMIDKVTAPDGYGGMNTQWVDGAEFKCAIAFDNSIQARTAQVSGSTELYTVITSRNINLQYHDVFRRNKDGKIFRVTSDGDDKYTPQSAGLDMRAVSAEEWRLPANG